MPTNGGKNYGKSFIKTKYTVTVSCTWKIENCQIKKIAVITHNYNLSNKTLMVL